MVSATLSPLATEELLASDSFTLYCQRHDLLPSIELGMELCGTYTKAAYDTRESFSRYDLPRLTSAQSLEMFLHDNRRIYGVNRAHEALAFVRDKSASPMETALVLLLCLPVSEGGYGLRGEDEECLI